MKTKNKFIAISVIISSLALSGCGKAGIPIIYSDRQGAAQNSESTDLLINVKYVIQTKDLDVVEKEIRQLQLDVANRHPKSTSMNVYLYVNYDMVSRLNEGGERYKGTDWIPLVSCISSEQIKKLHSPAEIEKETDEKLKEKIAECLKDRKS